MTLKNDAKKKKKLTCGFKYDMKDLVNFHLTIQKSEIFFDGQSVCTKYTRFQLEKYSYLSLNNDVNFQ